MALTGAERAKRYRLRQKGLEVVEIPLGPHKGYKQTADHIKKRILRGGLHPNFKGDNVSMDVGRARARRMYPSRPCEVCGKTKAEHHHKDGNTRNNDLDNIQFLCRRCHMILDGRMANFIKMSIINLNTMKEYHNGGKIVLGP